MKLNKAEFFLVNSRVRALIQEHIEFPRLRRYVALEANKRILEIGCGSGTGAGIINKTYRPRQYIGIDLDEKMVRIAKQKNPERNMTFMEGDVSSLPFREESFDAVFDFGVIHHIPNWKDCVREVHRVLTQGGHFILEDLSRESFSTFFWGSIWQRVTDHPYESMYRRQEFLEHLEAAGFSLRHFRQYNFVGVLEYFAVIASKDASAA